VCVSDDDHQSSLKKKKTLQSLKPIAFPLTLIMDYTMTHVRFGRSHLHPMGQLTNARRSDGAPDPDSAFKEVVRIKIRHYRNLYLNHPDPIPFIPLVVDTTGRMYDEFIRLLFFARSP
jgi:hypothetical protein